MIVAYCMLAEAVASGFLLCFQSTTFNIQVLCILKLDFSPLSAHFRGG
jgi:hypothetical protein